MSMHSIRTVMIATGLATGGLWLALQPLAGQQLGTIRSPEALISDGIDRIVADPAFGHLPRPFYFTVGESVVAVSALLEVTDPESVGAAVRVPVGGLVVHSSAVEICTGRIGRPCHVNGTGSLIGIHHLRRYLRPGAEPGEIVLGVRMLSTRDQLTGNEIQELIYVRESDGTFTFRRKGALIVLD